MKVSIITVCFNSEGTIRTAFESVKSQAYQDIEYIVIDGNSSDNTLSIAKEYSDIIEKLITEPDDGIYDAMNKGLSLASGDIIGILNSDDFYTNEFVVSDIVSQFLSAPSVDVLLGGVDFVKHTNLNKKVRDYSASFFSPWIMRFGLMPPHPAAFIKSDIYQRYGNYKCDYRIGADFDFFVRIFFLHRCSYIKFNKTLVRMRVGGVSTSGFSSFMISSREILRSLKENKIYSNIFYVSLRFPFKLYQLLMKR